MLDYNVVGCVDALCSSKLAFPRPNALTVAGNDGHLPDADTINA